MTAALVMAGGRGERMRAAGSATPKPLIPVRGIPLLERNLLSLLHSGYGDITVAVPSHTPEIGRFVRERGRVMEADFGCRLTIFEESRALGNIGAVAEIAIPVDGLLVVYADNLTSLDLTALVEHHKRAAAALTCAVHWEPFRIPFGEVVVNDGMIVSYQEKPERRILVSSGLFVLSPNAGQQVLPGQPTSVAALVNRLLAAGERVAAFVHSNPWIDVNDLAALERAEQLLASQAEAFEPWAARDLTGGG
jgi:NDP-sugar pyrophosphorylase family protein